MRTRSYPHDVKRFTGSGDIASEFTTDKPFIVHEIRVHLSAAPAGGETLSMQLDAAAGAAYDHVLGAQDMSGLTDFRAPGPFRYDANDVIDFAMTNSLGRTWGIEVVYEETK